jgi:mono/diheme cytochrome c family protein
VPRSRLLAVLGIVSKCTQGTSISTRTIVRISRTAVVLSFLASAHLATAQEQPPVGDALAAALARGKYMVTTGHCNNCHTAGYGARQGQIPENQWLMGNPIGWRSKAGTVFAPNLRLYAQDIPLTTWLTAARNPATRPPMPWWSMRDTSNEDLAAMYWYIRSLQPLGNPAPSFLPPEQAPSPPYNQLPDLSIQR